MRNKRLVFVFLGIFLIVLLEKAAVLMTVFSPAIQFGIISAAIFLVLALGAIFWAETKNRKNNS